MVVKFTTQIRQPINWLMLPPLGNRLISLGAKEVSFALLSPLYILISCLLPARPMHAASITLLLLLRRYLHTTTAV
jgi:hypothetical protein